MADEDVELMKEALEKENMIREVFVNQYTESISHVQLKKGLSGNKVEITVKVYNKDIKKAKTECREIFDELKKEYDF